MNELAKHDVARRLFCSFRTQGLLYGIDAADVREVSTQVDCTPVAQAPPAVRGLANLRSRIYLVIDVRPILGLDPTQCTSDSRLMVLKPHVAEDLGILVEHGGDIIYATVGQIEAAAPTMDGNAQFPGDGSLNVTAGVCRLESELMTIIDAAKLVGAVRASMQ